MIDLPFPSAKLSGHVSGSWKEKVAVTKQHRQWARQATYAWLRTEWRVFGDGDIRIIIEFVPPDNRSDRTNFPNRMKPYIDGIADALGVNDRRFVPSYEFLPPEKPGRVTIKLEAAE